MRCPPYTGLLIALLCGFLLLPPAAWADALADCAEMLRATGPVTYRGDAPDHVALCRTGYVLSFNKQTLVPDWVLENLTASRVVGDADRSDTDFHADEDLDDALRVTKQDYNATGFDRGHMAPAADMKWDAEAMRQSFLMSNMAPQTGIGMNRGIWARLEDTARGWATERGRVVVISGPVFDKEPKRIGAAHAVAVPLAFYKIVYDPERGRAIAFLLPNQNLTGRKIEEFIASIREVEDRTGLNFLSGLSAREQRRLENVKSQMWRRSP